MVNLNEMPYPMKRMLDYLEIDVARGFELMPEKMEAAMQQCVLCNMFHTCDYQVESRYLICPNRIVYDQFEDL
ncbi:MAG: hypothetical protein QGH63_14125 [Rhodospirillales bacterium]|jgi:hypothetical protein|nr:hypothetical protein [Rhodospirillales bacterium]MDP7100859.1 hypothetical protein [Rhodospirillales bacterium]MDP7424297.1 hypothetical protein [Rhodospirillales bacterium]MDP7624140.1 hypothetical protein [Rhodospirillales bacterium]|tara:strand:- start:1049 stop:1267 length:219 start_codon:yes stop_codon:yes gene_type:complete